jgi:hypothetical protein
MSKNEITFCFFPQVKYLLKKIPTSGDLTEKERNRQYTQETQQKEVLHME